MFISTTMRFRAWDEIAPDGGNLPTSNETKNAQA